MFKATKPPPSRLEEFLSYLDGASDEVVTSFVTDLQTVLERRIGCRVDAEKASCPSVPSEVIRRLIASRAPGCLCRQVRAEA